MNNDFEKILPNDNEANHHRLMELNNALNIDEDLNDSSSTEFEGDAAEGLQHINENKIPNLVDQINSNLTAQLKNKKRRRVRIPDQSGVLITIVTILLLVIVAYIVIKKMQ